MLVTKVLITVSSVLDLLLVQSVKMELTSMISNTVLYVKK